jgi:DNA-binding transcriptional ArsR family regulator
MAIISIFPEIWYKWFMAPAPQDHVARYADMLAAMGTEPRLRIVRLLLTAHPGGMIAGDIGTELDMPPSTLSHHLERLRREGVVKVRRERTFLWYTANADALEGLLQFLFAECCTRCCAVDPARITAELTNSGAGRPKPSVEESSS